jgi:hypothetical protein
MKKERVRICEAFVSQLRHHSMAMLDWIVPMDKSAVSFYTPQTKQQRKQWLVKGQPGPIKARVHASRTKQMVQAFSISRASSTRTMCPGGPQ